MVTQNEIQVEDVYSTKEHSKVADFWIGFGICWAVGAALSAFFSPLQFFLSMSTFNFSFIVIIILLGIILPAPISLLIARKYFPERRLIRTGIWVGFIVPILLGALLLGACFVLLSGLN